MRHHAFQLNRLRHVIIFGLAVCLYATEQETAWTQDNLPPRQESNYVFGYIHIPPDYNEWLVREANISDDPFADAKAKPLTRTHKEKLDALAPWVPPKQLPRCLPLGQGYRNFAPLIRKYGAPIKDPEWALFSGGPDGDFKLYFCTSWANADIIEQIFMPLIGDGPRSMAMQTTLVSIPRPTPVNNQPNRQAWTYQHLNSLNPTVHARYGIIARSGERADLQLATPSGSADIEYELTIGNDPQLYECRLSTNLPLNRPLAADKKGPQVLQQTAFTGRIGTPFVIDCGTLGNPSRQHLLVIHSRLLKRAKPDYHFHLIKRLDQIKGIYAMDNNPADQTTRRPTRPQPLKTYRAPHDLLEQLHRELDRQNLDTSPPLRLHSLPSTIKAPPGEQIFNITPQLSRLQFHFGNGERIYFNANRKHLLIQGPPEQTESHIWRLQKLCHSPPLVQLGIQILSVDHKANDHPDWNLETIKASNPTLLKSYASIVISGYKTSFGDIIAQSPGNPEKGEPDELIPSCEIEPVIGASMRDIDLRFHLETPPLGKKLTTMYVNTAVTASDGKPTIIELGHPACGTRSYLLVLHTNIVTTDGSYHRNRFKPVTP